MAGCMAPDFEYFIRVDVRGVWGHDLKGIVLFDLPMAVVMVVLFHLVVKNNLIDNLPPALQRRFARVKTLTLREDMFSRPLAFVLCACLGALTHVIWDGFTHKAGFFVEELPSMYDGTVVPFDGVKYPLWYALQQASTIFGLAVLVLYVSLMKPLHVPVTRPRITYWLVLVEIGRAHV